MGQQDKALEDYDTVLLIKPSRSYAYHNRAILHLEMGQQDKALKDYGMAIQLEPTNARYYFDRANL